ncbi:hypothetical protein [Kineococcus gypseus]|uniref:hypothetical protein n=1 Tax=Kineococcus gypseus TaxID=1637102 RepID=UPI003D7C7B1B
MPTTARRRAAAWALLVLALSANALASAGVLPLAAGLAGGVVALACATALVLGRARRRGAQDAPVRRSRL